MPHHALRQLSSSHYHLPMERAAAARFTAAREGGAVKCRVFCPSAGADCRPTSIDQMTRRLEERSC